MLIVKGNVMLDAPKDDQDNFEARFPDSSDFVLRTLKGSIIADPPQLLYEQPCFCIRIFLYDCYQKCPEHTLNF